MPARIHFGRSLMKRTALFGAVLAAFGPGLALADMNYTKFEISMLDVEMDSTVNVDGDGFALGGSFELNDKIFLHGEWQDQSLDFGIDGRSLEIGAGYTHGFNDKLDFVCTLSYVDAEVKLGNVTADDGGLALGGGIRSRVAQSVELDAGLKLVDFDNAGSDTG